MIKGSIHEEGIAIVNIYVLHRGTPQYIRQMLTAIKEEININTLILQKFNTPLTPMDRSPKQKICKKTQAINDTVDKIELIVIIEHSIGK